MSFWSGVKSDDVQRAFVKSCYSGSGITCAHGKCEVCQSCRRCDREERQQAAEDAKIADETSTMAQDSLGFPSKPVPAAKPPKEPR